MDLLEQFYLRAKKGMTVGDFIDQRAQLTPFIRSAGLMPDYRFARGRVKKLRDEVAPMIRFVVAHAEINDVIQFPLDDGPVDCNLRHSNDRHRKVQITVAQGYERFNCIDELHKTGSGRGFLGLTDDMSEEEFKSAMSHERGMYSHQEAQQTIVKAVRLCIEKKANKSGADTLLIEAPLNYLPMERWNDLACNFLGEIKSAPFLDIFLVQVNDDGNSCLQIK